LRYRIFLGSSTEALFISEALVSLLDHEFAPVPWHGDVFTTGSFVINDLLKEVSKADFAVFVFAADDVVELREKKWHSVRDNVLFELGLFLSRLGPERCFFLLPRGERDFRIPTDLQGITPLTYDSARVKTEPKAALAAAVGDLKAKVKQLVGSDGTFVSLSGRWQQNWKVTSSRYPPENPGVATVTQIGSQFRALSSVQGRPFVIRGQIQRGNVLTGVWSDREKGGTYFGAFQLIIDPIPNRMQGRWIGFSGNNLVKEGEWEWTRMPDEVPHVGSTSEGDN
jgi:hypothetical protein